MRDSPVSLASGLNKSSAWSFHSRSKHQQHAACSTVIQPIHSHPPGCPGDPRSSSKILHANPTTPWYILLQHPQSEFQSKRTSLTTNKKPRRIRMPQISKIPYPTLVYLSAPESTSVFSIPSQQIQAQKYLPKRLLRIFFITEPIPIDQNNIMTIASAPFDQWVHATSNWCCILSASLCRAIIVHTFQVRGTNPHTWHPQSLASLQRIFSRYLGGTIFGPLPTERKI